MPKFYSDLTAIAPDLKPERCDASNVMLPGDSNPHNVRPWLLSADQYGTIGIRWADCEQDAWDDACDAGWLDAWQVGEDESGKEVRPGEWEDFHNILRLGNASEPFDLNESGRCMPLTFSKFPLSVMLAFAEARGKGADTLDDV